MAALHAGISIQTEAHSLPPSDRDLSLLLEFSNFASRSGSSGPRTSASSREYDNAAFYYNTNQQMLSKSHTGSHADSSLQDLAKEFGIDPQVVQACSWLECVKKIIFIILFKFLILSLNHSWIIIIFSFLPDFFHDISTPHPIILFKHCVPHVLCLIFLFSFQSVTVMVILVIHLHATLFMPAHSLCHSAVTIHQRFPIHCYASFRKFLSGLFKNYWNCNIIQLLCNIIFSISWNQQLLFCYLSYLTH